MRGGVRHIGLRSRAAMLPTSRVSESLVRLRDGPPLRDSEIYVSVLILWLDVAWRFRNNMSVLTK